MVFFKENIKEKFKENADKRSAVFWLNLISFIESSFFPIPPDPFQIILTLAKPEKWKMFARNVLIYSVLGGIFGYLIGFWFFELFGQKLMDLYSLQDEVHELGILFADTTFWTIFIAALTPIPYKVFTISAGLFKVNFILFVIASIIGRGIRFFFIGYITRFLGERYAEKIFKYFDIAAIVIVILLILFLLL